MPGPYIPRTGMGIHQKAQRLGAGEWGLEGNPGARAAVDCGAGKDGRKEIHGGECLWRNTGQP